MAMAKYPLEWGWDQSDAPSSSTASDWKPKPTLLSGADPESIGDDAKIELAAAGDLRCQGVCNQGGSWGKTGMYSIRGRNLCSECAVKEIGAENLPADEQVRILRPFILMPR